MSEEDWRVVPGFPTYFVSNHGRICSIGASAGLRRIPRIKKLSVDKDGYNTVSLCIGVAAKTKTFRVARLVLLAFVGPCSVGMEAAHLNGNRTDNRLINLAWKTPLENHADKIRHGTTARGEKNYRTALTDSVVRQIKQHIRHGYRNVDIANQFGVSVSVVSQIKRRRTWTHV